MWFVKTNRRPRQRPLFLEKTEESADVDQFQHASSHNAIVRALGVVVLGCILVIALVFVAGCANGLAHSLNLSAGASKIFLAGAANNELMIAGHTEERRHIIVRGIGWTWWNGNQFGAWVALGTSLLGIAATVSNPAGWAIGAGGVICYLVAIAGGATEVSKARSIDGHAFIHLKGDDGGRVAIGLQPVDLSSDLQGWTLPANMSWHKVMDNYTANTYLAGDGVGFHGLVSLYPNDISKRNSYGDTYTEFDTEGDYIYSYLEDGNSAREYYYDHSYSDWVNYMPGLEYWLIDGEGSNTFQPFCMVPQDSQGNAVAAIAVQTNSQDYDIALNCATQAEEANDTFDSN